MRNTLHFTGKDWMLSKDDVAEDLLSALLDCSSPGDASDAVAYVLENFAITGDPADCAAFLRPYGAWDDDELSDHQRNLERLVWLAGCDLDERGEAYFAGY